MSRKHLAVRALFIILQHPPAPTLAYMLSRAALRRVGRRRREKKRGGRERERREAHRHVTYINFHETVSRLSFPVDGSIVNSSRIRFSLASPPRKTIEYPTDNEVPRLCPPARPPRPPPPFPRFNPILPASFGFHRRSRDIRSIVS